jgi:formate dehydrogenase major subunit
MAHVIVTEGLADEAFIRERCDWDEYQDWARSWPRSATARNAGGRDPRARRRPARRRPALCHRRQRRDLLRPWRDRAQPGFLHRDGIANLAMATGNIGRPGVGVNPAARPEQRAGQPATWAASRTNCPAIATSRGRSARQLRGGLGRHARSRAGPAHPQHARCRARRSASARSTSRARISSSPIPTRTMSRRAEGDGLRHRPRPVPQRNRELRPRLPAGQHLPRKDGTFTNAERRIQMVRKVMEPANGLEDWEVTQELAKAMGLGWDYHIRRDHGRDRPPDPDLRRASATPGSMPKVRCNGRSTMPRPMAARSCTSTASCAARASSW